MRETIIENSVLAYLDHEDSPDISNPIHSTAVAKSYGFSGPLVGGVTVWKVGVLLSAPNLDERRIWMNDETE